MGLFAEPKFSQTERIADVQTAWLDACRKTPMNMIKKRDLILAALILLAAAAILLYNKGRAPAAAAQITSGSRIVAQLHLSRDQELDVESPQGGHNHLTIRDGEIWCSQADCPDKLCVKQGKKSLDGDTIVCLPNQMAVTILAP